MSTQALNLKQKKQQQQHHQNHAESDALTPVSTSGATGCHLICTLGFGLSFLATHNFLSTDLISDPSRTLLLIWLFETPIVVLLYSRFRNNPRDCSYWRAVGRGLLGIPLGALINIFGATALGAPIEITVEVGRKLADSFTSSAQKTKHNIPDWQHRYLPKTISWSLLMLLLTFVPATCVFGLSCTDWQHVFARTKPIRTIDYMICLPAHGAIIGAWFGGWPMPLDWEKPWQEWPVCVRCGAMAGYLVAMVASLVHVLVPGASLPLKQD